MLSRLIIFGLINFAALGLGSYFTGPGVQSEWYQTMNRAPWEPPGWVFGAAWTIIMICFSIYLAILWDKVKEKQSLVFLFGSQFILNVIWSSIFFNMQKIGLAAVCITALTMIVFFFILRYWSLMKEKSLLLAPYAIWLCIACSLNYYAWVMN